MAAPVSARPRPRLFELPESIAGLLNRAALPLLCLLPFLLYLPFLTEPFEGDEGAYATVAQGLLHGGLPYRDFFDHKPPLIYVYYAVSFLLFGQGIVAPRILMSLAWAGTTSLVFLEGKLVFGRKVGLIAAGLFGLSISLQLLTANANTEAFMLLPLMASLVAFTKSLQTGDRRWLLLCGAAGGIAALTKQVAVWNLAGYALFIVVAGLRDARAYRSIALDLALVAGSSLVVLGVALVPFALSGGLGDFYYAAVVYNQLYSSRLSLGERFTFTMYGFEAFLMVASPYAGCTLLALFELRRRRKSRYDYLLILSLASALAGVLTSGFYFRHYFVALLPFASLLCAPVIERAFLKRLSPAFLATATALIAACLFFNLPAYLASTPDAKHEVKFLHKQAQRENAARYVASYLDSVTTPDQAVYDFGRTTQIYFYANRKPAIRYIYDRSFFVDKNTLDEAMQALERTRPVYITDTEPGFTPQDWNDYHPQVFEDFLAANYDYVGKVYFADIYRLKGTAP